MTVKTAQLVGLAGEFAGRSFPVGDSLLIGRQDSAGLRLPNLEVSRRHCQVERTPEGFRLVDLGSRSGTRLNDESVQSAILADGDLLAVGQHVFRFELVEEGPKGQEIPSTMAIDDPSAQMMLKEILVRDYSLAKQLGRVTALENLERLRHHLEVVQEFSKSIQTTLDTRVLIERTLDELFRVFSKMDAGVLFLRDTPGGQLVPAAIRRRQAGNTGPVGYSTTILHSVEAEQKAVVLLDVSQDERFQNAASVKLGSMRTHMCVPLVVPGEVVGAIYLVAEGKEDNPAGFDAEDLALLTSLSGTVAVCVKNAALAREAQRNAQLSSSLQRYVSPEVTRRLMEQGVAGALGARTVEGVAMFCDLVGFTSLSQQLSPERIARLLNRYFCRSLDIVFAHHGSVNKFGGDSFLAVWGAIDATANDLEHAVRAALEIQNDTFRLSAELAAEGLDTVQLTIGLNRGRFFAGDIGSDDRLEFTVIGDAVNVAARIQALAHGTQVLTTLESLGPARASMSLLLYPDTPIRGRTTGVTVTSVRAMRLGGPTPGAGGSFPSLASDSTQGPEDGAAFGQRVLASIPVEIPQAQGRGMLTSAILNPKPEIELLCDRRLEPGQTYELVPIVPEWEEPLPAATAQCTGSVPGELVHQARMRVTKSTQHLVLLLSPGSERVVSRPLRKKP